MVSTFNEHTWGFSMSAIRVTLPADGTLLVRFSALLGTPPSCTDQSWEGNRWRSPPAHSAMQSRRLDKRAQQAPRRCGPSETGAR